MKIEQIQIEHISAAFQKMQSKEDLLQLLNEVKPLIYGEKCVPFELKQITWYANPKRFKLRYIDFKIKKKSGGERSIHAPVEGLKAIQKVLSIILQCVFEPHKAAMGFVRDKSIVENARIHERQIYVYNIDLKDFFSTIDKARVWKCLQLRPFNLKKELTEGTPDNTKSGRQEIANILAALCCTEMDVERKDKTDNWVVVQKEVLPQGAPTSPVITNIICYRLDYLLSAAGKRFGLKYSRYADDITFSSMHNVYQHESDFLKEMQRIILDQGFHIKESKTRLQKQGYRQEVTGLLVNEKVNVRQRYIKQLRAWLYFWERYGYSKAEGLFLKQYISDKGYIVKGKPSMKKVIEGKLNYLKMVKGSENELYLNLKRRYEILSGDPENSYVRHVYLDKVVEMILSKGLNFAMEHYKPLKE